MRRMRIGRELVRSAQLGLGVGLALLSIAAPAAAHGKAVKPPTGLPIIATGGVGHVHGISATLEGTVDPHGLPTLYYFQYGPAVAKGAQTFPSQTATAGPLEGSAKIKVGLAVVGLVSGDRYRLVAENSAGRRFGKERVFSAASSVLKFELAKATEPTVTGNTYTLSGVLAGTGGANQRITLQASPYPYLTAFSDVGLPIVTNAAGRFSFSVRDLTASTEFRVSTLAPRPVYSRVVTAEASLRVRFSVRSTAHKGLIRLYGTVTPAEAGARVEFQLEKAVRPGSKSEQSTRYATQFSTVVKRATKTMSRFSMIVSIAHGGRYRALVVPAHKGALVSGASQGIVLHVSVSTAKKTPRKK